MPCGILHEHFFDYEFPEPPPAIQVEHAYTRTIDKSEAERSARNIIFRELNLKFKMMFGELPLPSVPCPGRCPQRSYMLAITYDSFDIKRDLTDQGIFPAWKFKAKGRAYFRVYCLKKTQHLRTRHLPVDGVNPPNCSATLSDIVKVTQLIAPAVSKLDIEKARMDADSNMLSEIAARSTNITCPKPCPKRVTIYSVLKRGEYLYFDPAAQQQNILILTTWRLYTECVKKESPLETWEDF